jgi:DnaJ-class molecular chaperone
MPDDDTDWVECTQCNGTGRLPGDRWCGACGGNGGRTVTITTKK